MSIMSQLGEVVDGTKRVVSSIAGRKKQEPASRDSMPPSLHRTDWNLRNIPPENDPDVGPFFHRLVEDSVRERNRLNVPNRFQAYYQLFRGRHLQKALAGIFSLKGKPRLSIALIHANVTRTVANITARAPVAEVFQADGIEDGADQILSEKMRIWNNKEEQQVSLASSVLNMEMYGITVEKAVYDVNIKQGRTVPLDPFAWLPAPGYYRNIQDMPYQIHMFSMPVEEVEAMYDLEPGSVMESTDVYSQLGEEREEDDARRQHRSVSSMYPSSYVPTSSPSPDQTIERKRALVYEVWVKDYSTRPVQKIEVVPDDMGNPVETVVDVDMPVYPGGIRVVTITNNGHLVCADQFNPNINQELPLEFVSKTYLFSNFPFFKANSYEDTSSVWGYPVMEVVGDINLEIDELWSSIINYLKMAMYPPLVLPKDSKVNRSEIRYLPRLVIEPISTQTSQGIRWLPMPTPPSWMFNALSQLIAFFDRISQIEDADRGSQPGSVIAASAIEMLQERGAVLVRAKIRAVDHIVRERGRCFISFYQNWGVNDEITSTGHGQEMAKGIDFIGREFNYVVESGSTVAKTSGQIKQEAVELYKLKAIDRQALLQQINFPDWKKIVERLGESELQAALSILIQSGLPEEMARELYNFLVQDQGGPGDASKLTPPGGGVGQPGAPAQAGIPKRDQGAAQ
jgi:hypothetical protein